MDLRAFPRGLTAFDSNSAYMVQTERRREIQITRSSGVDRERQAINGCLATCVWFLILYIFTMFVFYLTDVL